MPRYGFEYVRTGDFLFHLLAAEQATPIRRLVLNDFGARLSASALRRIGGYLTRSWKFESIESLEVHLRDTLASFGLSDVQWRALSLHSAVPDPSGGLRFHFDPAIGARFAIPIGLDIVLWTSWDKIEMSCPHPSRRRLELALVGQGGLDASPWRGR